MDGIIVGSNQTQEWLLPWWWENYQRHNQYPVTFFDFGLSSEAKIWCRQKGNLVSLPMSNFFVREKEEVDLVTAQRWEGRYGEQFWASRNCWFKKPFACSLSPYDRTIWLDLDCEIVSSLQNLFSFCEHPSGFAIAKDQIENSSYNSGVMVFKKNNTLIEQWAHLAWERNGQFRGDQDLLSKIILDARASICELPQIYNWIIGYGLNSQVVIYHWVGEIGKQLLRNQLILDNL